MDDGMLQSDDMKRATWNDDFITFKTWFHKRKGSQNGKDYIWGITLQEDLDPRSRTERTLDIQNGGDPRAPKWPIYGNDVTIAP